MTIRVVLYAYRGRGLGHLSRLTRLARTISALSECHVVSGHRIRPYQTKRITQHLVPDFEIVRSRSDGQKLCTNLEAVSEALGRTISQLKPDLLITDHLPGGKFGELAPFLDSIPRKYLILRPVLAGCEVPANQGFADKTLIEKYDRILVAGDRAPSTAAAELAAFDLARDLQYLGYVPPAYEPVALRKWRELRQGDHPRPWVVCSAGSGVGGSPLIRECIRVASFHPDKRFIVVAGPYSKPLTNSKLLSPPNLELHRVHSALPLLHYLADVVICHGGYNAMIEALAGRGRIGVLPSSVWDREQETHARRLSRVTRRLHLFDTVAEIHGFLDEAATSKGDVANLDFKMDGGRNFLDVFTRDF